MIKRPEKIGVVYSKHTKVPRRIVVPAPGDEWEVDLHELHPSEEILHLPGDHPHDAHALRKTIASHHGISHTDIPSGRAVVVQRDTNQIVDAIMAEPEIDSHEHLLVSHDYASPDDPTWKYDNGAFYFRQAKISKKFGHVVEADWKKHEGRNHLPRYDDEDHVFVLSATHQVGDVVYNVPVGDFKSEGTRKI